MKFVWILVGMAIIWTAEASYMPLLQSKRWKRIGLWVLLLNQGPSGWVMAFKAWRSTGGK